MDHILETKQQYQTRWHSVYPVATSIFVSILPRQDIVLFTYNDMKKEKINNLVLNHDCNRKKGFQLNPAVTVGHLCQYHVERQDVFVHI